MKRRLHYLHLVFLFLPFWAPAQQITKESFSAINLSYSGLEKTNKLFAEAKYDDASKELLKYLRSRKSIGNDENDKNINKTVQELADNALAHKFKPQKGYGFFDYGKDIDWKYWPVKDFEVRVQLHRVTWWEAMGQVYRSSGDEKYTKEWIFQFKDWAAKNAIGLDKDNDQYAWRPLEVSGRVKLLAHIFNMFVNSPNFTPAFLMEFLKNYNEQVKYVITHYTKEGNHLLFEAQNVLTGGAMFPEFKNAAEWRNSGLTVLNTEIQKQVYPDGMQWELSTSYHVATIGIFLNAYITAKTVGMEKQLLPDYSKRIKNMILATANFSFPDYNVPMFGDSWVVGKASRMKNYQEWLKSFPDNQVIKYFATDGTAGALPDYLSHGLTTAGFYTFRNGWKSNATVMVLKASPPGEFHAQPDNGTFELWVKGRDFTPDAGCFLYGGDEAILKQRNWYRQTRVHSTLTLDNQNMVITKAQQNKWETGKTLDVLTYTNPSYADLSHQRSVLFIDQKYFLFIDQAVGKATGNLGVHWQLKEDSKPIFDKAKNKVYTTYADGNNLLIQSLNTDKVGLREEEGKVSYVYAKEITRPAFVFEKAKEDNKTQQFVSVVYPYDGDKAPEITLTQHAGNDYEKGNINLTLTIDGKKSDIKTTLFKQ